MPACRVIVPANQLSLAIGNRGQNARLAAGLTGYKIDIISDAQAKELEEAAEAEQEEKALEGENEVSELELADALEEVPAEGESEV